MSDADKHSAEKFKMWWHVIVIWWLLYIVWCKTWSPWKGHSSFEKKRTKKGQSCQDCGNVCLSWVITQELYKCGGSGTKLCGAITKESNSLYYSTDSLVLNCSKDHTACTVCLWAGDRVHRSAAQEVKVQSRLGRQKGGCINPTTRVQHDHLRI